MLHLGHIRPITALFKCLGALWLRFLGGTVMAPLTPRTSALRLFAKYLSLSAYEGPFLYLLCEVNIIASESLSRKLSCHYISRRKSPNLDDSKASIVD